MRSDGHKVSCQRKRTKVKRYEATTIPVSNSIFPKEAQGAGWRQSPTEYRETPAWVGESVASTWGRYQEPTEGQVS